MSSVLLDTNAYAALAAGDERVLEALSHADTVYLSVITLGELHAGFRGGSRQAANRAQLAAFLGKPTVQTLEIGPETAEIFGQVKDGLRRAGMPIPINDVWLAAQAIETGSVLVSFDDHFTRVPGIRLWEVPPDSAGSQ
ncbi:MAG: type II toxin-antitoxin system VapC family toxin [Candidatus Latescibacterota bacterium]